MTMEPQQWMFVVPRLYDYPQELLRNPSFGQSLLHFSFSVDQSVE